MSDTQREMTAQEREAFMAEPVTRGELLSVFNGLVQDMLMPVVDSRFAFTVEVMRHMFSEAGVMDSDQFSKAYQKLVDEFTAKYGGGESDEH